EYAADFGASAAEAGQFLRMAYRSSFCACLALREDSEDFLLRAHDNNNDSNTNNNNNNRTPIESVALPAIGCGCRGYPLDEAIETGLQEILRALDCDNSSNNNSDNNSNSNSNNNRGNSPRVSGGLRYIEMRFWDTATFRRWLHKCEHEFDSCSETEVKAALWDGRSLEEYTERKNETRMRETKSLFETNFGKYCSVM
ncbi:unnamed protein product, partial [Polarella glacialis]